MDQKKISVIIPALNEGNYLGETLSCLKNLNPEPFETIGVDGGSTDRTSDIFKEFNIPVIQTHKASRPIQMNAGSRSAKGNILVFLHADTLPPPDLVSLVQNHLSNTSISLGGFTSIMQCQEARPVVSWLNKIKTSLWAFFFRPYRFINNGFRILFGDQVMFCRKEDFLEVGGFNESYPVLEDAELCIRMNRKGRIRQFPEKVYSSDRRISRQGISRAMFIYVAIAVLWTLGFPPKRLGRFYKHIR